SGRPVRDAHPEPRVSLRPTQLPHRRRPRASSTRSSRRRRTPTTPGAARSLPAGSYADPFEAELEAGALRSLGSRSGRGASSGRDDRLRACSAASGPHAAEADRRHDVARAARAEPAVVRPAPAIVGEEDERADAEATLARPRPRVVLVRGAG